MKRVAVVGAGFCGLAVCWHLQQLGAHVDLFDERGVGAGASGMASGLLHPYPGRMGRRSWRADEAMAATQELLLVASQSLGRSVVQKEGILRYALDEEQELAFAERSTCYQDFERVENTLYLIRSGMTVDSMSYLQGLFAACTAKGAQLYTKKITHIEQLEQYDQMVLAAGKGILLFPHANQLPLRAIKGQILKCDWPHDLPYLERSLVGNGYVATCFSHEHCYLGATFEKDFQDDKPLIEFARKELMPKMCSFFSLAEKLSIVDCLAGIRIANRSGQYRPIASKVGENCFVLTAMGSRGLLYHALMGRELAQQMME